MLQQKEAKRIINTSLLEDLANWLKEHPQQEAIIAKMEQKYGSKLKYSSPQLILDKAIKKQKKGNKKETDKREKIGNQRWCFNEYVIFVWVTVYLCCRDEIDLHEMKTTHYEAIYAIFEGKCKEFVKYEILSLIESFNREHRQWTKEEQVLLTNIAKSNSDCIEWKYLSFQLFCLSKGKYFRPISQCRQRWMNYLNPRLQKQNWTVEEDLLLMTLASDIGCQWSKISKKFNGRRTEHMIKNRFNHYKAIWIKSQNYKGSFLRMIPKIQQHLRQKLEDINQPDQQSFEIQRPTKRHQHTRNNPTKSTRGTVGASLNKKQSDRRQRSLNTQQESSQMLIDRVQINFGAITSHESEKNLSEIGTFNSQNKQKPQEQFQISHENSLTFNINQSLRDNKKEENCLRDIYADAAYALGCPYYQGIAIEDSWLEFLTQRQTFKWIE